MKKITIKSFFAFAALISTLSTTAQELHLTKSTQSSSSTLELTEESQRSLEQTGFVRCASVEMDARRKQRDGDTQSKQDFENWLAPLIEARKAEVAQQKAAGTFVMAVVNIPIIFHVITDGTNPTNVSAAQIQAQIDQLNLDFGNLAGSTHPAAADAQIVFVPALKDPSDVILAEAGINRVTTFGAGPFPTSDFDVGDGGLEIKNSGWDRTKYANIWTADITGGILGYAQFPSNSTLPGFPANGGTAINDGVVIGYGTAGSVANPGSAAPYNLGRTLTHEIGHWIGLRHIWGDSNCGDDYCADTPESTTSNGGCPTQTTCDGVQDMVENYMDYTNDACMNIFTNDQVGRMVTVLTNADGISDLPNSDVATLGPVISFANATQTVNEATDCSYTDIVMSVNIANNPSAAADITVNVTGGTATVVDYQIIGANLTFPTGASADQTFTLRVFNDSFVEADKTIILGMNLNANGGDATLTTAPSQANTITIANDDVAANPNVNTTLVDENMEASTGWTIFDEDGDGNDWGIVTGLDGWNDIVGKCAFSETDLSILGGFGSANADNYFMSPTFTVPASASTATISYVVGAYATANPANSTFKEHYTVYFSTVANPTTAVDLQGAVLQVEREIPAVGTEIRNHDMVAYAGQTGYLAFRHHNTAGNGLLLLDTVNLSTVSNTDVQTLVNTPAQDALSSTGLVYTSDASTGNVMADITNSNGVDYGCVSTSVSRATGTSVMYQVAGAANYVMGKTFMITPASIQTGGNATVKFYFTEAEIAEWEGTTGNNRSTLAIIKDNGATETVVASLGAFGPNVTLEATFTSGINGTYYFGKMEAVLGISQNELNIIGLYPNPSNGIFNLSVDTSSDSDVTLFDLRGRKVYSELYSNNSDTFIAKLDFSAMATGVYMLQVKSGTKQAVKKIVIR